MKKQKSQYARCFSSNLPKPAEMCHFVKATLPTVSGTSVSAIVVIQFTYKIPNTFTCCSSAIVIMSQPFVSCRPALADLSASFKVNDLPTWDFNAKTHFAHSF